MKTILVAIAAAAAAHIVTKQRISSKIERVSEAKSCNRTTVDRKNREERANKKWSPEETLWKEMSPEEFDRFRKSIQKAIG